MPRFTSLHQPSQSDSQEGDVNVRPEVITVITARNRSCQCLCTWKCAQMCCECWCVSSFWITQFDILDFNVVLANNFTTELPSHWVALMQKTKQEWNHKWRSHNISAVVDKCNYHWCSDSVYSLILNDSIGVIPLFPHSYIASLAEMQSYLILNVIKL